MCLLSSLPPHSKPSSPKSSVAKLSLSSRPTSSSSFNALRKSFPSQTPLSVSSPSCFLVRPFYHLAWIQTDRKSGGLGDLKYPLVSDVTKSISKSYDVLIRIRGISLRGNFIIDKEGIIQRSTINSLAIYRSVVKIMRTLQALQYVQDNPGGKLLSPSKHVEMPSTMQYTLHLSLTTATATTNSLPKPNKFPSNTPTFPSLSRHRSLHFPALSSTKTSISLPPKPPKPHEISSLSPPQDSNFQEKMLYLDSIGIDFFSLLPIHPPIISASAAGLKSVVDFLRSTAGLTTTDIRRVVAMCPEVLTSKISALIPVFTFLLREAGVDGSDLRRVIHRRPRLLACNVETRLRPTLYFLQSIGIVSIKKYTSLLSCSVEQKFVPRMEYFRKIGFSQRDTMAIFRKFPPLFCYSIKDNFEPKFNYFVMEMGRELKELKEFPQYFSYGLESRIKPRHQRCLEKGVSLALPLMFKTSEERFEGRLEMFSNSSIPVRTSPLWCTTYDEECNTVN